MSLIDDALKRAQAAGPVSTQRSSAWTPTHLPERRAPAVRSAFMLAIGLMALTGAAWILTHQGSRVMPAPVFAPHVKPLPTASAAESGRIEGPEVIVPPPVLPAAAARNRASAEPSATIRPKRDESKIPSETVGPRPDVSSSATAARSPKALADGKSYTGEVSLPNGSKIELDGIVFSEANPVALLNGRVIAPGGSIEGMTLSRVEPDRVELQGHGVTVFLLVK